MPVFSASRRIPVTPDIAFAVAADVASYKEFLPLLKRSTVRGPKTRHETGERFDAELMVAYEKLKLSEAFVSRVETETIARIVTARSSDGPFKNLEAKWTITEAPGGSDVAIAIDYTFKSAILQLVAGGLMDFAVQKVMAAFETRAAHIQRIASATS